MNKSKLIKYKEFYGSIEYSLEDLVLHGKIECINDLITYEAETLKALKEAFHEAVEDYLETCKELNKAPDKPMSGSFNIRPGEERHKKMYLSAKNKGITLNECVNKSMDMYLSSENESKEMHLHVHIEGSRIEKKSEADFFTTSTPDNYTFNLTSETERTH